MIVTSNIIALYTEWIMKQETNAPVQQYAEPRTQPTRKSCKEFSPEKWLTLKTNELIMTACHHFNLEERDDRRNPR